MSSMVLGHRGSVLAIAASLRIGHRQTPISGQVFMVGTRDGVLLNGIEERGHRGRERGSWRLEVGENSEEGGEGGETQTVELGEGGGVWQVRMWMAGEGRSTRQPPRDFVISYPSHPLSTRKPCSPHGRYLNHTA